jgi:hypothetical protein
MQCLSVSLRWSLAFTVLPCFCVHLAVAQSGTGDTESRRITMNSPWAKTLKPTDYGVSRIEDPSSCYGSNRDSSGGSFLPTSVRCKTPAVVSPSVQSQINSAPPLAFFGLVTVRWESAEPVLALHPVAIPDDFRGHYVISVSGLPPAVFSGLPNPGAIICVSKRKKAQADLARLSETRKVLLLGFPASALPIRVEDKTIDFMLDVRGIILRTHFVPREMMAKSGKLDLKIY